MSTSASTEGRSAGVEGVLSSWRDGDAKRAIVEFVAATCDEGSSDSVPPEERVAVFDNDGTLWCEKPMPIQLDFIVRRLVEMAVADAALRDRQSWKAAYERDYAWLNAVVAEHYAGDEHNVKILAAGVLAAYDGISVEDFETRSETFLRSAQHPTLGRGYLNKHSSASDPGPASACTRTSQGSGRPLRRLAEPNPKEAHPPST